MSYTVVYSTKVLKRDVPALSSAIKLRIKEAIHSKLEFDPIYYGKPLQGTLKGYRSMRVGDYRVLYTADDAQNTIFIIAIEHRSEVYKH